MVQDLNFIRFHETRDSQRFVELNVPRIIIDLREKQESYVKLIIINKVNYHLDGNSEIGRNV